MQNEVRESSELLTEMIKDTPDYRNFLVLSEKLKQNPELSARVQEFRKRNYELQNSSADPESVMWEMNGEYQELLREPLVSAYFETEAGYAECCRRLYAACILKSGFPNSECRDKEPERSLYD